MTEPSPPAWLDGALRYAGEWIAFQVRQSRLPGCTLAVSLGGALVAERSFGVADLARDTPLTPAHRFRVASHSKVFTAAGVMLLREAGRLHLDDPVGRHVPGLSAGTAAVTVAELLSHGGGLMRDGTEAGHWLDRRPFPDEAALRAQLTRPLVLEPNSRLKYSNLGFGLLGLALEAITGEPFADWIARSVVAPSGLAHTTPDLPPDGTPLACGHGAVLPMGERSAIPGRNPTRALAAATGFTGTAGDLARFVGSLDPTAPASVLSAASRREMVRHHRRVPHCEGERHYGLGVMAGAVDQHRHFGHGGAFQGFISRTACVPEWGTTVSVTTNAIDGLANQWVEGVIGILHRFALHGAPDPALAGWAGRWWSIWGALDLVPMGDRVLVAAPAGLAPFADASEIAPDGADSGRIALAHGMGSHGEAVRLHRAADGTPQRLRFAGSELLPEAAFRAEAAARAAAAA